MRVSCDASAEWLEAWDDHAIEATSHLGRSGVVFVGTQESGRGRVERSADGNPVARSSFTLRRRQDRSRPESIGDPSGGPQSRGAGGVGDVAGERGDRAPAPGAPSSRAGWTPWNLSISSSTVMSPSISPAAGTSNVCPFASKRHVSSTNSTAGGATLRLPLPRTRQRRSSSSWVLRQQEG